MRNEKVIKRLSDTNVFIEAQNLYFGLAFSMFWEWLGWRFAPESKRALCMFTMSCSSETISLLRRFGPPPNAEHLHHWGRRQVFVLSNYSARGIKHY